MICYDFHAMVDLDNDEREDEQIRSAFSRPIA
jgi:hypothetical protein